MQPERMYDPEAGFDKERTMPTDIQERGRVSLKIEMMHE